MSNWMKRPSTSLIIITLFGVCLAYSPRAESAPASPPGSLVRDVSIPPRLVLTQSTALPAPRDSKTHLVDGMVREETAEEKQTRILLGFLAGEGLEILAGGLAFLASKPSVDSPELLAIPVSAMLLGSSLGVIGAEGAMGGRGRFGYALLGSIIGFAVPLAAGIGLAQFIDCNRDALDQCGAVKAIAVSMIVLPTVGAIVGYESSAPKMWLSSGEASRKRVAPSRVVPVLALSREGLGATVGIAGTL